MMRTGTVLKVVVMSALALVVMVGLTGQGICQSKEPVVLKSWVPNWPSHIEPMRVLSNDLKALGIEIKLRTGNLDEWVAEIIGKDSPYHTVYMSWTGSPARMEPTFFLRELYHSSRAAPGGRNYGNHINKEYDDVVDAQMSEMDMGKRQKLIRKAQEILAKDNATFPLWFRDYVQAYNTETVEGVVPTMGSGIGFPHNPWTFWKARPKTKRRELKLVNMHDIHELNPFAAGDAETEGWLRLAYDTFAKRDPDTNLPIPWAAESWNVVDDTTVDIVLRAGMAFHDGKPVTVEDVKFTFDYIKKWEFPMYSRVWHNVESVEILKDRRVRFKLFKPYAAFADDILLHAFIAPKHIWEKIPESVGVANPTEWPNPDPVGSGPFEFNEWKKAEYFHYKANKNHFMAPNFDGLYVIVVPSIEGMMGMLEKGDVDIYGWTLGPKQVKRLNGFKHIKVVSTPSHGFHEIRPNLNMKPMNDPMFRKAMQYAINRKGTLDIAAGGYGTICANTPITPLIRFWNNPDIKPFEFSMKKAREILKSAGYTWDEKGRLCYP